MFPLTRIELLSTFIIGVSLENIDLEPLVVEFGDLVAMRLSEGKSVDETACEVHEILKRRGQKVTTLNTDNTRVYKESPQAASNVEVWKAAGNIASARMSLQRVRVLICCLKLATFSFYGQRIGYRESFHPPI